MKALLKNKEDFNLQKRDSKNPIELLIKLKNLATKILMVLNINSPALIQKYPNCFIFFVIEEAILVGRYFFNCQDSNLARINSQ